MENALIRRESIEGSLEDSPYCKENDTHYVASITTIFFTVATVCFVLRLYTKKYVLKLIGPEDWLMLAAWTMALGTQICFYLEMHHGLGKHTLCLYDSDMIPEVRIAFYHCILVMIGVVLVKLSIAFFLMRMTPYRWWKWFLWGLSGMLCLVVISCLFTVFFACRPIQANWDTVVAALPTTKCLSHSTYTHVGLFNTIFNCVSDFVLAFLPIPIIAKLQVSRRQKVALSAILALGLVACIAGSIKAYYQVNFFNDLDVTWKDHFMITNYLELTLGIIAANLPCTRPLFVKAADVLRGILVVQDELPTAEQHPQEPGMPRRQLGHHRENGSDEASFTQILKLSPRDCQYDPTMKKHITVPMQTLRCPQDGRNSSWSRPHPMLQVVTASAIQTSIHRASLPNPRCGSPQVPFNTVSPIQSIPGARTLNGRGSTSVMLAVEAYNEKDEKCESRFSWVPAVEDILSVRRSNRGSAAVSDSQEMLCPSSASEGHDRPSTRDTDEIQRPPSARHNDTSKLMAETSV